MPVSAWKYSSQDATAGEVGMCTCITWLVPFPGHEIGVRFGLMVLWSDSVMVSAVASLMINAMVSAIPRS